MSSCCDHPICTRPTCPHGGCDGETGECLLECGSCGRPRDEWPGTECDDPVEGHPTATRDCDCGEVLKVDDPRLHLHQRCNLIP